jgi:hypothetical protein
MSEADPEFVNAVSKVVCQGTTKFVALLRKQFEAGEAFLSRLLRNRVQPFDDWHGTILVPVEEEFDSGHWILSFYSNYTQNRC